MIGDEDNISATVTVSGRGTSEFSNCFAFVPNDANGDGVPDVLEENVSGDGDFNDNGVPDIDETLVTAVQTFSINGGSGAVLPIAVTPQQPDNEVKIRQIKGIPVEFAQIAPPAGINFPLGLIVIELEVDQPRFLCPFLRGLKIKSIATTNWSNSLLQAFWNGFVMMNSST